MSRHSAGGQVRPRALLILTAAALAVIDLVVKVVAERGLADGRTVDLGILQLRLGYNAGVAFSVGAGLPVWVVLATTGAIALGLGLFAWRSVASLAGAARLGVAGILAGAIGNVVDRAGDGRVTDYLHTGWWPTFNLADVWITVGAVLLVLGSLRSGPDEPAGPRYGREAAPGPGRPGS